MYKKGLALVLAAFLLLALAGCGGSPGEEETVPAADSVQENAEEEQKPQEDAAFPVPTQNDPPSVAGGINMVNLLPEDCTEVVYDGGVYIYKLASPPTGETLVNFINEKLIPGIQACSDTGTVLVQDPAGREAFGLEWGAVPFRAFDSFGYGVSDSGREYAYWLIDGQQFANERQLSEGSRLLDIRYLYDGVLYDAITKVREEDQAISVTPFEEPNQDFAIVE